MIAALERSMRKEDDDTPNPPSWASPAEGTHPGSRAGKPPTPSSFVSAAACQQLQPPQPPAGQQQPRSQPARGIATNEVCLVPPPPPPPPSSIGGCLLLIIVQQKIPARFKIPPLRSARQSREDGGQSPAHPDRTPGSLGTVIFRTTTATCGCGLGG